MHYCEYCGGKFSNIQTLTGNKCHKHPNGTSSGPHKLYEGNEKPKYTCKYCGQTGQTIAHLVVNKCPKHPDGTSRGHHSPAL